MRCTICDYSEDYPSILNDGLTDGNSPRKFFNIKTDPLCEICAGHVAEVALEWKQQGYDADTTNRAHTIDPDWDR
jgi:hypothetical protein